MELKSSYIKKSFDLEGGLWLAYTEYMRFQALLEYKLVSIGEESEIMKVKSEMEQMQYLL